MQQALYDKISLLAASWPDWESNLNTNIIVFMSLEQPLTDANLYKTMLRIHLCLFHSVWIVILFGIFEKTLSHNEFWNKITLCFTVSMFLIVWQYCLLFPSISPWKQPVERVQKQKCKWLRFDFVISWHQGSLSQNVCL